MLLCNLQRRFNAVHTAVEYRLSDFFLTLHLRFNLNRACGPRAFQLIIQMPGSALAGKRHVLAQQVIGVLRGFRV